MIISPQFSKIFSNLFTCCCWCCAFEFIPPPDKLLLGYWEGEHASLDIPTPEDEPGVWGVAGIPGVYGVCGPNWNKCGRFVNWVSFLSYLNHFIQIYRILLSLEYLIVVREHLIWTWKTTHRVPHSIDLCVVVLVDSVIYLVDCFTHLG